LWVGYNQGEIMDEKAREMTIFLAEEFNKIIGYCTVGIQDLLYLSENFNETVVPNGNTSFYNRIDNSINAVQCKLQDMQEPLANLKRLKPKH
jgi:hypothetical protein